MDICLRVQKESNKRRFDSYSVRNSVLIISHNTFQDCRVHIFPTTFLEIAVKIPTNNHQEKCHIIWRDAQWISTWTIYWHLDTQVTSTRVFPPTQEKRKFSPIKNISFQLLFLPFIPNLAFCKLRNAYTCFSHLSSGFCITAVGTAFPSVQLCSYSTSNSCTFCYIRKPAAGQCSW